MTEIKKITKIALLWYCVAGLLFAFFFLVLTDFYAWSLMMWSYNDPFAFWSLGGTMLVLSIASLMAYFKKEWEEIKLFFELMLLWVTMMIILDIISIVLLSLPTTPMMYMIVNIILLTFNLVLGIYCWIKQKD